LPNVGLSTGSLASPTAFSLSSKSATLFLAALAAVVLAGIAIRLVCVRDSLWADEIASLYFAHEPLANLWSDWMRRETNPPLYYTALKAWMYLMGEESDQNLRLLSLAYSCGAIVMAGVLGKRVAGPWAGLAAAALMAVSPAQVHYGVEVRAFAQAQLMALIALWGAIAFFSSSSFSSFRPVERNLGLGLYVGGTIAAIYSHTVLVLLPVFINACAFVWLGMRWRDDRRLWPSWIGANGLVLAASGWWLSITIWQLYNARNLDWIARPTASSIAEQLQGIYGSGAPFPDLPLLGGIAILVAAAISIVALIVMIRRYFRDTPILLAVCAVGAPGALFLLSFIKPVMIARAFFWAGGSFLISVAIGLRAMANRSVAGTFLGCLLALNLAGTFSMIGREDGEPYRQVAEDLSRREPGTVVIADSVETGLALQRYCPWGDCAFDLRAVEGWETWTADVAMQRISARQIPAILSCEGEVYTVQRPMGEAKRYVSDSAGIRRDLSDRYGLESYLKVTRLNAISSSRSQGSSSSRFPGSACARS